jgi:CheY-like chemotaxis protein
MDDSPFDRFVGQLRSALNHLYDPDELRRSPLTGTFGIAGEFDAAAGLQRILTDAIEALRPAADEPAQSRAWRIYDALAYRYVRGFDREVVADQLGISGRQFRREQRAALEVLAQQLWQVHGLAGQPALPEGSASATDASEAEPPAWLKDLPPEKPGQLQAVLAAALDLARPLARQWNVHLENASPEQAAASGQLTVPQTALRYALLNVLGVAIPRAAAGVVRLSSAQAGDGVLVEVVAPAGGSGADERASGPLTEEERGSLDVARQLVDVIGGQVTVQTNPEGFRARLAIPTLEQVHVLVVDDNADTLQLFARYAVGTRYAVTGTREPGRALQLAEEVHPAIVVLDVMMPDLDGWEMLARLREHPSTGQTAVIICTVLPQQALALALGANAFLQKPVTREAFLAALDGQSAG